MSTTVTYKSNTLTTVDNTIKTLKTAGKYMEGDIILTDVNNTLVINLSYNDTTEMWEPDCTYAEAYAAYQAGKQLLGITDQGDSATVIYSDGEGFIIDVYEYFIDDPTSGYTNYGYKFAEVCLTPSGLEDYGGQKSYITENSNAVPSDVANGKHFYNANGIQTGTATGGTIVIRDSEDSHGGTVREITASSIVTGTKTITENGTYDVAQYLKANVTVAGHTATITHTVGSTYIYPSIQVNGTGTEYHADGAVFKFNDGDTFTIRLQGTMGGGTLYLNGAQVYSSGMDSAYYTWTPPSCDLSIDIQTKNNGYVYVTTPVMNISANGSYEVPNYGYVNVSDSGVGGIVTGTFTLAADATTTTKVTDISTIGFTPTKFIFFSDSSIRVDKAINTLVFESIGSLFIRFRAIYSELDGILVAAPAYTNWTNQNSGQLYLYNNEIRVEATSSYILKAGTYTWWAIQ